MVFSRRAGVFAPREKRAYVAGFLAGVALADGERDGRRTRPPCAER